MTSLKRAANCTLMLLGALLLAMFASTSNAQTPVQRLSQLGHTTWRVQDGAFTSPNSITQTKDGYIWIGTNAGLVRFDGVRFVPWNTFAGTSIAGWIVDAVFAASDGSLWLAANTRVAHVVDGAITTYKVRGRPLQFIEDDAGAIWFAQTRAPEGPLCRIAQGQVQCHGKPEFPLLYTNALSHASGGGFWVGAIGGLCRWVPGSPATCHLPEQLKTNDLLVGSMALESTHDGQVWVGIDKSGPGLGLGRLEHGAWKPFVTPELDGSSLAVSVLLEDRNGSVWVGSENRGLYRIHQGRVEHFGHAEGLSSDAILDLQEDREGVVWVVTSVGVDALRPLSVSRFSMAEGLPMDGVQALLPASDGAVWAGGRALSVIRNGVVATGADLPLFRGKNVTSMMEDHAGRIWIGLDKRLSTFRNGLLTAVDAGADGEVGTVVALTETNDNDVWALASGGGRRFLHFRDQKLLEEMPADKFGEPSQLAANPQGGLWLGYRDGDMAFYDNGKLATFHADATSRSGIAGLVVDADGSVLAATSAGLLIQEKGARKLLDDRHGLACNNLRSVVRDRHGDIWMNAECGLIGIRAVDLKRWKANPDGKIDCRLLDVNDGAEPGATPFSPSASLAPDGRLWFSNGKTASVIDPDAIVQNALPPPVHIEELTADRIAHAAGESLELPAQTRDIEIRYTALSFVVPKMVKFQYLLEGRDRGWQDAGTRRQAFYTDLPPGSYRFRVKASNNDGVWNESGASLKFEIPPRYYQTRWFAALCVAVVACMLYGFYVMRLRQVAAAVRDRLAVKNNERERIARDLHDTLLQSTQGLILRFQAASNRMAETDPTRAILEKALERADEVLAEGRDRVRELRVPADSLGDLTRSLALVGEELAQGRAMTFRIEVDGEPRQLEERVNDEAYVVGREALSNAFRHGQGSAVEVCLTYSEAAFCMLVRDDGVGIADGALEAGTRAGHWGVHGMRERAKQIGAGLDVRSHSGRGTEIDLRIPAAIAYGSQGRRRRWLRSLLGLR